MIGEIFKVTFANIDRTRFNINSYPEYMATVNLQLYLLKNVMRKEIKLSHVCHGENIYKLDPNKSLFSITPIEKIRMFDNIKNIY